MESVLRAVRLGSLSGGRRVNNWVELGLAKANLKWERNEEIEGLVKI